MMSLTFGLFTQVSGSGPLGPLVLSLCREGENPSYCRKNTVTSFASFKLKLSLVASYVL